MEQVEESKLCGCLNSNRKASSVFNRLPAGMDAGHAVDSKGEKT